MKRVIVGTSGATTSEEYIKRKLFDYLADSLAFTIDGADPQSIVDRIRGFRQVFDIDDVIGYAIDEQVTIPEAVAYFEDQYDQM